MSQDRMDDWWIPTSHLRNIIYFGWAKYGESPNYDSG
eukprot:CAMPEP_0113886012 /NCGR_PEP_ID=MMETSP0780_2-20120614/11281_1 /TAXON_ID=652834 /ORGANISM="Palpitomonas bilix" /LENGTH=36 /DNA_ID=CAMNT_0000874105 /DNA_START=131 /DNA_END=238 /DNA_ORIENTATION=+ /assembly_acc=CAM_ASM_000599